MTRPARPPAFTRSPRPAGPFGRPVGGAPPALPDTPTGALARRIRARRVELGWSQADLAAAMGQSGHAWHQTTVAKTERAEREPRYTELMALAAALDLDLHSLISPAPRTDTGEPDLGAGLQRLEQEQHLIKLRHDYVTRDIDSLGAQREEMAQRLGELDSEISTARKAYEASRKT